MDTFYFNGRPRGIIKGGKVAYSIDEELSDCTAENARVDGSLKHARGCDNARVNGRSLKPTGIIKGGKVFCSIDEELSDCTMVNARVDGLLNHGDSQNHWAVSNGATVNNGMRSHEIIDGIHPSANNARNPASTPLRDIRHWVFNDFDLAGSQVLTTATTTLPNKAGSPLPEPMNIDRDEDYDSEPPEHLLDKIISFSLIHEAVTTPNGDTYDRPDIERNINLSGICPVTRQRLDLQDLRPNRALQQQIFDWKAQHRTLTSCDWTSQ